MAILVILAIGLLVPAAAAVLAQRRGLATRLADIRGVALQTVIVIVVMLVIAGAVAGVLLTRGGEVVSDLEQQEVGPVTEDNCTILEVSEVTGRVISDTSSPAVKYCIWEDAQKVSRAACTVVGGHFDDDATTTVATVGDDGASVTFAASTFTADDDVCGVRL